MKMYKKKRHLGPFTIIWFANYSINIYIYIYIYICSLITDPLILYSLLTITLILLLKTQNKSAVRAYLNRMS